MNNPVRIRSKPPSTKLVSPYLGHLNDDDRENQIKQPTADKKSVDREDCRAINSTLRRSSSHYSTQPTAHHEPAFSHSAAWVTEAAYAQSLRESDLYKQDLYRSALNESDLRSESERGIGIWAELAKLRYIFSLFLATRAVLVLIGLVSYATLPRGYGNQTTWSNKLWLDMWGVWDSLWYMDIAQNGYSVAMKLADYPDQTNFPFFPLYPLLMRFLGYFTGGDAFIAGLIVSNSCLILACYLLYKLAEMEWGSAIARRSVKYLFLFPVSFILSGVFTESLYLCLSLSCFYLAKRRRWWLAGLCGGLLSATRTLGVLIALPLLVEYIRSKDFNFTSFSRTNFRFINLRERLRLNALFVFLIPTGLLAFSYYNYRLTGDFLFFKTNQAAWDREIMNPLLSLARSLSQGIGEPSFKKLLECAFFVGAFGLLTAFYRRIGFAYWLLGMYSIWIPLSAGVASMPRFTLPIFPLFFVLAILSQRKWWNRWLTLSLGALQGALMVLWCTGQGLVI